MNGGLSRDVLKDLGSPAGGRRTCDVGVKRRFLSGEVGGLGFGEAVETCFDGVAVRARPLVTAVPAGGIYQDCPVSGMSRGARHERALELPQDPKDARG
jgi:hypothetical protein